MTIFIESANDGLIETLRQRSGIFQEWVDVEKEYIPVSIHSSGKIMEIYVTDEFAKFTVEFFALWLQRILHSYSKEAALELAKEFRRQGEEFFVSNIVLTEE